MQDWKRLLAQQSACLILPVIMPSDEETSAVEAQERRARQVLELGPRPA